MIDPVIGSVLLVVFMAFVFGSRFVRLWMMFSFAFTTVTYAIEIGWRVLIHGWHFQVVVADALFSIVNMESNTILLGVTATIAGAWLAWYRIYKW